MHARIRKTLPVHSNGLTALGFRADGRPIWPIKGGAEGEGGNAEGGEGGNAEGAEGGEGEGQKEGGEGEAAPTVESLKAEADKWKALARKHEKRAGENAEAAKELARVRREGLTEGEKATQEAADKARAEERSRFVGPLVKAEFKAAAAGRQVNGKPLDLDTLLDDIDVSKYVDESGEVDVEKVAKRIDAWAPPADDGDDKSRGGRRNSFGQGRREGAGGSKPSVQNGRDLYAERHKSRTARTDA